MASPEADWSYSQEAEQSVLGALLADPARLDQVARIVGPEDFRTAEHAAIFRGIVKLRQLGRTPEPIGVADLLNQENGERFAAAGGLAYLRALVEACPTAANAARYAEIVRDRALCRRLDNIGQDISRAAHAPGGRGMGDLVGELRARLASIAAAAQPGRALYAAGAAELIALELPELEPLLEPWLFQKNLCMVHSRRGIGKTHYALGCAFAVAAGAKFLHYRAPKPRGVLYVDGEMPAQLMQRRIRELAAAHGEIPERLRIITPDVQELPMPDLATFAGQADIDALVTEDTALIVIDNLSCLVRSGGAENESESWTLVAEWALKHRRAGRAVMFIHHSGKSGAQRGTSKREDLLDVVINLRRPADYREADGAVFTVHFEKARSLTGEDIAPIEARLEQLMGDVQGWTWRQATTVTDSQIKTLWEIEGMTVIDVAREAGVNKSTAARELQRAMKAGELKRPYPSKRGKAAAEAARTP